MYIGIITVMYFKISLHSIFMPTLKSKTLLVLVLLCFSKTTAMAQLKKDTTVNYDVLKAMESLEEFNKKRRLFYEAYTLTTNSNNFETDMFIFQGDILRFKTSGKISTGDFSGYTGPGGHTSSNYLRSLFKVVADKPYGALLCKIGEDGEYRVLGDSIEFTAQTSGRLKFLVNDTDTNDNLGKFKSSFLLKSDYTPSGHEIQKEGSLVYLTENQRKELERIRAERQYKEENKERLAEEARIEEERKSVKRAEAYRLAKAKSRSENPVTLTENEAKDLLNACIGYTLTFKHEAGFVIKGEKSEKINERILDTNIEERRESHKNVISTLIARGASSQLSNFTESLQVLSNRIDDPTDDLKLANAVLNTMDSSTVGLDMPQIRNSVAQREVMDLIVKEKEESVTMRFSVSKPAGGFFGGKLIRWGLKNSLTGEVLIKPEYFFIGTMAEGLRFCKNQERVVGFLDEDGQVVIPFIYMNGSSFSSGMAPVTKNKEKWGFINRKGEVVIPFKFAFANSFDIDYPGLARVTRWLTNQVIYIDTNGKRVKNPK